MAEEKKLIEPMIFNDEEDAQQSSVQSSNTNIPLQKGMDFDVRTKSIEEKLYIILYKLTENEDEVYNQIYSICVGRTDTYNDIKNKLVSGVDIDLHKSLIITETKQTESASGDRKYFLVPLDECVSVYAFCIQMAEYFSDDTFSIEDYNTTLIDEDDDSQTIKNEDSRNANSIIPHKYTAEELEYRKMLEESMKRDKFMDSIRREQSDGNSVNNI